MYINQCTLYISCTLHHSPTVSGAWQLQIKECRIALEPCTLHVLKGPTGVRAPHLPPLRPSRMCCAYKQPLCRWKRTASCKITRAHPGVGKLHSTTARLPEAQHEGHTDVAASRWSCGHLSCPTARSEEPNRALTPLQSTSCTGGSRKGADLPPRAADFKAT